MYALSGQSTFPVNNLIHNSDARDGKSNAVYRGGSGVFRNVVPSVATAHVFQAFASDGSAISSAGRAFVAPAATSSSQLKKNDVIVIKEAEELIMSMCTHSGTVGVALLDARLYAAIHRVNATKNVVYSPLSLALPLSIVACGADGKTEDEFIKLFFPVDREHAMDKTPGDLVTGLFDISKTVALSGLVTTSNYIFFNKTAGIMISKSYESEIKKALENFSEFPGVKGEWVERDDLGTENFKKTLNDQ